MGTVNKYSCVWDFNYGPKIFSLVFLPFFDARTHGAILEIDKSLSYTREHLHETPFHEFNVYFNKSIETSWSIVVFYLHSLAYSVGSKQ